MAAAEKPTFYHPRELSPERAKKIIDHIRNGNFIDVACRAVGVHRSTYYNWRKAAERPDASPELRAWVESLDKAEAESETEDVQVITNAARQGMNVQAAMWRLERKFHERWGRTEKPKAKDEDPSKMPEQRLMELLLDKMLEDPKGREVVSAKLQVLQGGKS